MENKNNEDSSLPQEEEIQEPKNTCICENCGEPLEEGQRFCTKCGASQEEANRKVCSKCGAELEQWHEFCPKCGQKADLTIDPGISAAVNEYNTKMESEKNKAKKKPILIGGIVAAVIVLALIIKFIIPVIFVSTEKLLAEGNYQKAYSSASKEDKSSIKAENIIAYISKDVVDSLKDPSSFDLRHAWYDSEDNIVVMQVGAKNSLGSVVSNYWYYTYDKDDEEYELFTTLSDLDNERTYSWDDSSERLEKLLKNLARDKVKKTIADDSLELNKSSVDNINHLFKEDILDNVELIKDK